MTPRTILPIAAAISLAACGVDSVSTVSREGARGRTLFVTTAVEHGDGTVTLPLYRGASRGRDVYYVILDASDGAVADEKGVNVSRKLARARGTGAVQRAARTEGVLDFPATVRFDAGVRAVVPGPTGFPPDAASSSAMGEEGYSPLVELPDGTILNAPHVANATGHHPKVIAIDRVAMTVTLEETDGFAGGKAVRYVSTESSHPVAAALENVTFAPALDLAPELGEDGTDSSRTSLAAFVNGRTGAGNPERQGLSSAILDGLSPLNVLRWSPNQGRYSPLWDVHLAAWAPAAIAAGEDVRQDDFGDVLGLAAHGLVTAPDGGPFGASGFIVNCPIIAAE